MIINYLKRCLYSKIRRHVRGRYPLIKAISKQGMFNHRCYYNAAQFVTENTDYNIVEVMYIDNDEYHRPILHYLNEKDGLYYETTLGYLANEMEYYLIRKIHESDHKYVSTEFDNSLKSWDDEFLKWYHKLFFITRCV